MKVMKARSKMTDEQLALMIERCFGKEALQFDNIDTFEIVSVAENAMELIDEEVMQSLDFSFDISGSQNRFEPLAMCGFLGDEDDEDISQTDDEDIDNNEEPE